LNSLAAGRFNAVLFDLDGTLVDTAPDMVAVLQELQRDRAVEPVAYEIGRSTVSNGAMGLLRLGFPGVEGAAQGALLCDYMDRYADRVCRDTVLFEGIEELLRQLEHGGRPWGVVTNKPGHLTTPLLEQLALTSRLTCAVSGDTLPQKKPDPAPLLHACRLAGVHPANTVYVGDAARDIEAGRRARMATVAAAYGYIVEGDDPAGWGADRVAADTEELTQIVLKAVNL
jgi:phosphoglycolate phosphatase